MSTMEPEIDVSSTAQWVIYVYSVSVILTSLEYLSISRQFSDVGYYSWKVFRITGQVPRLSARLMTLQNVLLGRTGVRTLLLLRLTAAVGAITSPLGTWRQWLALAMLAVLSCIFSWRQKYGEDGADQMTNLVGITLFLVVGPFQPELLLFFGICFIALQAMLSYLSAGVAKLISPVWQSGAAVGLIVDNATYGSQGAGNFLRKLPGVGKAVTWGTVLFEVTFPVMIFLPWPAPAIALVSGACFHLSIALVMGLNNFVPAFLSTYPALFFVSQLTNGGVLNLPG